MEMKKIILVFFQCLVFLSLCGRDGGYSIRNYSPKEYNGFNQVWCSLQDSNGVMYFGTSTNIFAYDGKTWTPIPVVSGNPIRSLCLGEDGTIYVGSYGSFGYLEKQISGQLIYRELSNQLPKAQNKFTDVWKIYTLNGEIVFQSSEGVYFFKKLNYLTSVLPSKTFALSFLCDNHLYIRQRKIGIQEIINHQLKNIQGGEIFSDMRCLDIIPGKNGAYMALSGDSGFFSFSPDANKQFQHVNYPCDKYLRECYVLGTKYIDDSTISIMSRDGLAMLDLDGNIEQVLNTDDGLIDNSVSNVTIDREGQLWLTTGNGISHVFYHSNAHYYRSTKSGFDGDVNSLVDFNQHIYLATTTGLYRSVANANEKNNSFEQLGLQQTEIWELLDAGGDLMLATSLGACIYREEKPVEYLSSGFTRDLIFDGDSSTIYCAEMGGVRALEKKNNKWETKSFAETPGEQQSLLFSQYNYTAGKRVWTIGQSGVLYRIDFSDKGNTVQIYSAESGINESVLMFCIIGDSVCAKTLNQIFVYHPDLDKGEGSKCFFPSAYMKNIVSKLGTDINFNSNEKGKLVMTTNISEDFSIRRYGFFKKNKKTGLYYAQILDLLECPPEDFIYSYVDSYGDFWLCYAGMIVHYDAQLPPRKSVPFHTFITHVTSSNDSVIFTGIYNENPTGIRLEYKSNNLIFKFAAPSFNHEELTHYSYKLEGFDKDWSPFSTTSEKEYTNLPEGDYVFLARSTNALGVAGKIARYPFTILPPWYRTIFSYIIYLIVFLFTIYLSIRLGARRLRKQKEKLEILVTDRTAEVVEQSHKIEAQNFELETAYKGIQDSIHYAERIQHAILPVQSEIYNSFPDSFVFFRPRDIVSGDFYWFVKRGDLTWIACVDCTGHGVPGAFMSMIGNTMLNEIVLEKNIDEPDKILNLLHLRIRQALRQDVGGETRDGMDISLCFIDDKKKKIFYAGANRALWMIRKNELRIFPPNKFSIGGDQGAEERIFTLHETELQKGDCIYLSSDGYADQFGGDKGKKFMVKRFQDLLKKIHALPMSEQHDCLEKSFLEWKGKLEQVDDVLVIGFRFE